MPALSLPHQRLTQRPTHHIANTSPRSQTRKHHPRIDSPPHLGRHVPHDPRPRTRERPGKETVHNAKDVQQRQVERQPPQHEHADRRADRRDEDTRRHRHAIDDEPHQDTPKHGGDVVHDDGQRRQQRARAEHGARVRRQVDVGQEEAERLEDVAGLEQREGGLVQEAQVEGADARRLGQREARLDVEDERGGEDEAGDGPDAEGGCEAPFGEELLHDDGEDDAGEACAGLWDCESVMQQAFGGGSVW